MGRFTAAAAFIALAGLCLSAQVLGQDSEDPAPPGDFSTVISRVKTEIDLGGDQEREISSLFREYRKARREIMEKYASGGENDRAGLWREIRRLNADARKRVEAVLDLDQMERFREIVRASRREDRASGRERMIDEIVEVLELTSAQESQVRGILETQMEKFSLLLEERGDDHTRDRREMRAMMREIREETERELARVLSAEQMEKYREHGSTLPSRRDGRRVKRPPSGGQDDPGDDGRWR